MQPSLITAHHLSKSFRNHKVVDSVSLSVRAGEILTIIGPNGSGKTTLIKLLLGLIAPDSGTISKKPNVKMGYVPQSLAINPVLPLTVSWFLRLSDRHESAAALGEITRELGVFHLLNASIHALSGGEMQRVLIARALLCEPELLILDEPAQGVDVTGQAELYALIAKLSRARNTAVLMVSHDLHLVMRATDHVICLNHHVCCSGHPHSVQEDPAFAALFGQKVADSLAIYTHHHDHEHHHHV